MHTSLIPACACCGDRHEAWQTIVSVERVRHPLWRRAIGRIFPLDEYRPVGCAALCPACMNDDCSECS